MTQRPLHRRPPCRAALGAVLAILLVAGTSRAADLRTVDTKHYRIHTDLDRELADDLAIRMDAMFDEYARRLVAFNPTAAAERHDVYLFKFRKDYQVVTGEDLHNTGGVYIPGRNLLAAFLEGQGRDGLRRTLQHEAFHQFAYTSISKALPVWLNEGMAQLFEEAVWTGEGFWLGHAPPRRLRQLRADLDKGRLTDVLEMLVMTPEQWAKTLGADGEAGATMYNQAWAMVHFLTFAPDEHGKPLHRARLVSMLRMLHEGWTPPTAWAQAFGTNYKGFQDRFVEYAKVVQPTPTAALIERQAVLGDLLSELSRRGMAFDTVAAFKRAAVAGGYRMQYKKGDLSWESDEDVRIYFADLGGRALAGEELFFERRAGSALPDIICRPGSPFQFRTRFHKVGEKTEHEVVVERVGKAPAAPSRVSKAG